MALAWGTGAAPSPCFSALLRDVERASLETPAVRRIYTVTGAEEQLTPLGYAPLGGDAMVCDLGPESLAGWLSTSPPAASTSAAQRSTTARASSRSRASGSRSPSSRPTSCATSPTARASPSPAAALLRDVWGYEWGGGANAVDVAISALRRKLGAHARAIATVRGVGFRFTGWTSTTGKDSF